ncbi:MAG: GNAT family N-acetyltransferase [Defluviitaleaceae bacterium]|nr:GNAT family N-acetyltransferase [Defluviitaleaceae bacterium]
MRLIKPTIELKEKALAYRQAHFDADEKVIDGDCGFDEAESYESWLSHLGIVETGRHEVFVLSSTYFAEKGCEIVGVVDIRHHLNEHLLKVGGHISYSVHPNQRRKGYATEILRLALHKCRDLGIKEVLVTCNKANIGSHKTILNNGGVLEDEYVDNNGSVTLRHWISI